jgi:hypothetical protein
VLGAGATLANALYFRGQRMANTRPPLDTTFFATVQARGIQLPPALRGYMRSLLRTDPLPERIRQMRMEDFFKDVFFDFQDSPTNKTLRTAYTQLVEIYVRVLQETTNWLSPDKRTGGPIGRLLAAAEVADNVTVITFNHDLVIENEVMRRRRLRRRWCLDQGYGAFGSELNMLVPRERQPTFQLHEDGACDHTRPIRVLKLHGSLNWYVRINGRQPTARTLSGSSGERDVHLVPTRQIQTAVKVSGPGMRGKRGRPLWYTWPIIIPPVYAKQALRKVVQRSWDDALAALQECDRLVFFGYSLPQIDIEAEKLFERGIAGNDVLPFADVVDPAPAAAQRYAGLAPAIPIRWYPSLDKFMADGFSR